MPRCDPKVAWYQSIDSHWLNNPGTASTPAESEISTGHILRAIVYPDSTNAGTTEGAINSDPSDVISVTVA